jgi:hypothetical protein
MKRSLEPEFRIGIFVLLLMPPINIFPSCLEARIISFVSQSKTRADHHRTSDLSALRSDRRSRFSVKRIYRRATNAV